MYNLSDNSAGFGHVGGAAYGGAGIQPTVQLATAPTGGYAMPMMMGGGCGFGGGWGGDSGIWAILLLSLLGRGGWGNDGGCGGGGNGAFFGAEIHNSDRFNQLSDQINASAAAGVSATNQAATIAAVRALDSQVCAGFLQTQKGFGDVALANCQQTAVLGSNIASGFAGVHSDLCNGFGVTNSNIAEAKFQNALAEQRTQAQLASCCCDIQRQASDNTCRIIESQNAGTQKILDKLCASEIQGLRDKLFEKDQMAQTCNIVSALSPKPPVAAYPVWNNAPIFQPAVSAESFCGFGGNAFGRGGCCG